MTDEQVIRHYEAQERYQQRRNERYHSDPDYREHRRRLAAEAQRRYRQRLRQMMRA